ncbi:MAG: SoxR reducing system RseC family protein [Gammaproteobacteria bacterium]|nr:SoxR reducing system RseC family protein [Gammaproteobacteria bacterium]MBU1654131.1 SoxR reducing system RseC family protein [Gammaproteobacteria bacterium]MBU1960147.1 SoxR reducing system RseC family protein [Gammaproteobacteria bacterium]
MIETEGRVVAVESGRAWVETVRSSACGHCDASGACGTALLANTFGNRATRIAVDNRLGARVGDRVVLGLPERAMLAGSFLLYIPPLIGLFLGALLGQYYATRTDASAVEPWSVLGGLLGLMAVLAWRWIGERSPRNPGRFRPVMVRRLAPGACVPPPQIKITEER